MSAIAEEMAASVQEVTATMDSVSQFGADERAGGGANGCGSRRGVWSDCFGGGHQRGSGGGSEEMSASAQEVSSGAQSVSAAVEE